MSKRSNLDLACPLSLTNRLELVTPNIRFLCSETEYGDVIYVELYKMLLGHSSDFLRRF